ncbi:LysR family transcriptional regulator [Volucribacter psittacicida]|uniref:LysR family transcriptional regulator n=1 Tax=Volucribacter psittacicida TaxID=203482 RepID=A0A4R1FP41_9PAST|nr:LysR family transcriptional regulator [Volucribacter psittacicida]TCJ94018.1 LysR family transcriptional regulator [Volucribacter psittacicida]
MLEKDYLSALYQFMWVAELGSFSQAADKLNMAQAGVSRSIKGLEQHLGVRLLNRTTRRLSLTQAGEQIFHSAKQSFGLLEKGLNRLDYLRDVPSGKVRINASRHAIDHILIPKLAHLAKAYPDIELELIENNGFVDIIAERYDAGVRLGGDVAEGMVAVKISPKLPCVVVGTPALFEQYGIPKHPADLVRFPCLAYRLQTGRIYDWEFNDNGDILRHKPSQSWVFNDSQSIMQAAKHSIGLAYEPADLVQNELANGCLISVLTPYCIGLDSFYLYYPNRNISPALRLVVDCLRE